MRILRQSTAITLPCGPFVDKGDGVTAETGIANSGRITKNGTGAAFTASSWSHDSNGMYLCGLSTDHTDTIGHLRLHWHDAATFVPVWEDFRVLDEPQFDSLFAVLGTDYLQIDVLQWLSGAIPAVSVTGIPKVDPTHLLGTAISTPATAGILDVNIKNIANAVVNTALAQLGVKVIDASEAGGTAILNGIVEGTLTTNQVLRVLQAVLAGKSSGGGTLEIKFRNNQDNKDRVTASVDALGNRTSVTLDVS